nr:toxin-antitoxin system HicB family antitoxin [Gluconacetobacter tumulisoli]
MVRRYSGKFQVRVNEELHACAAKLLRPKA